MLRLTPINTDKDFRTVMYNIKRTFLTNQNMHYYVSRIIHRVFEGTWKNYMARTDGGTDEFGNKWAPLAPATVVRKARVMWGATIQRGPNRLRPSLTAQQDQQWRGIYSSQVRRGVDPADAASLAWAVLKSRGATTMKQIYANHQVPINIETHRLETSLRPGTVRNNRYQKYNRDQVVNRKTARDVDFGTKVGYSEAVNARRQFLYEGDEMSPWGATGVTEAVPELVDLLRKNLT